MVLTGILYQKSKTIGSLFFVLSQEIKEMAGRDQEKIGLMCRFHLFKSSKLHTYLIFKFWYTNIDSTLLSQTIVCQTMFGKVVVGERLPT